MKEIALMHYSNDKSNEFLNICSDFHLGRHFFGLVGGFFVGLSVTLPHEIVQKIKILSKMKTLKLWRIAFMMLAAMLSLASCSSDDDNDVYEATELGGTWQKVYDEGVADAGTVQYTFHPQSVNNGTVDIFTSDWAAGETTVYRIYTVTDAGHLQISPKPDDTSVALTVDCDIRRLTSTQMIWNKPGTSEEIARFTKEK